MTRHAAILIGLILTGCAAARTPETKAVDPGAEITLTQSQTLAVKGTDVAVHFVAVTEDSRCPRDVTCVWAGEVKVLLEVGASRAVSPVEILEGGNAVVAGYRVTLVRVEPQRTSTAKIAPQDYRATLKIDNAR